MHSQKYFATLLEAVHQFGMCQLNSLKVQKGLFWELMQAVTEAEGITEQVFSNLLQTLNE